MDGLALCKYHLNNFDLAAVMRIPMSGLMRSLPMSHSMAEILDTRSEWLRIRGFPNALAVCFAVFYTADREIGFAPDRPGRRKPESRAQRTVSTFSHLQFFSAFHFDSKDYAANYFSANSTYIGEGQDSVGNRKWTSVRCATGCAVLATIYPKQTQTLSWL